MDTNSLLSLAASQLRRIADVKERIEELNVELSSLLEGNEPSLNGKKAAGKRQMSPAARRRIAEAQKARWARQRGEKSGTASAPPKKARKKRTMSPEARKKIADAQKARWAKQKGEKPAA